MKGLMMDFPLTLTHFLERARRLYPHKEVVTKTATGMHRYTYADFYNRVQRLANVLERLGVGKGDRVATFAWNNHRHLELYFAVPCMGAVLHTINIRLFPDQIVHVMNHADDKVVFIDDTLAPALERVHDRLETVETYVMMSDSGESQSGLPPVRDYETLMAEASADYDFPALDEDDAAGMCYTSGTTGDPKGVVYSHRSLFLHSMGVSMADSIAMSERDIVLPVVPMFHANAWGMPFAAVMTGAKLVFPGPHLQPRDLAELIQEEEVTLAAGVPTIWIGLYHLLQRERYDVSSLRTMPVGGAAAPRSLIEGFDKDFGVHITHAWGMTEMTPVGTVCNLKSTMRDLPHDEQFAVRAKQGLPVPGVEIRVVDDDGNEVAWDGESFGELQVRGPWVISGYYNDPRSADAFQDGWFRTGDVVTVDAEGYMQIVDRTKDLVKSGGEWISSVDLENAIMAHPEVMEAAVIAIGHPKWQERPLAVVVPTEDAAGHLAREEVLGSIQDQFASWWLPDDVVFVDSIPKTSVGKFDKKVLRDQFDDYTLPDLS